MLQPKMPENEHLRLKVLHDLGILDTEANENFDRITQTAKVIFKVSGVLISVVM